MIVEQWLEILLTTFQSTILWSDGALNMKECFYAFDVSRGILDDFCPIVSERL